MAKPRQFRPSVLDSRLESRVVLSVTASQVPAAILQAPAHKPVATSAAVSTTLNQLHDALLNYQGTVTNAILYTQSQIAAGKVSKATAINLLESYIGNKTSRLFFQTRSASGNLPFGSGFNGYVNTSNATIGDLPSGADSLYAQLTFPTKPPAGPIATLQNNVFTAVSTGNFTGALKAVNSAAIHSTYAQVKSVVTQYVANGVKAHDFTFSG